MFQFGHAERFSATPRSSGSLRLAGEQRKSASVPSGHAIRSAFALALLLAVSQARADFSDSFLSLFQESSAGQRHLYISLYTTHYDPEPDHVNDQNMLGFEFGMKGDRLWGFALFDNSFGQDSQYLYMGKKWDIRGSERWYFKLTGGVLHGYKEPYDDKIPFNGLGVAPAVVPAVGYRYKNLFAEFAQLGFAAGMINVGMRF